MAKLPHVVPDGTKFGALTVLRFHGRDSSGNLQYLCECSCGLTSTPTAANLMSGNSKACRECRYKNRVNPKSAIVRSYGMYRRQAASRKLEFRISFETFESIVNQPCYYCGAAPRLESCSAQSKVSVPMNGIDRSDSKQGYFETNCVPCCSTCNLAKLDSSKEDFVAWILRAADNLRTHGK